MKYSTWFTSSVCLSCFYLLQNLPVTQFFIHHLKYTAGWKDTNYILRLCISSSTAWKANTKDCQEAWHVPLLSHFWQDIDTTWQQTKFPFVYWFVYFLSKTHHQTLSPYPLRPYCRDHGLLEHDFSKGSVASVYNHRSATLLQLSLPLADKDSLIQQMLPECPSEMEQEQL